ncbi:fused (3R)-hydroxyacyl-ACP dehydratase subunits HadA/HadB [Antrihabitans stalactiti]|uniref:fused (3R)-hydroxyacyl-ACP dehydratase subunits HadA/HadB n=1 Tax=Antrihabitans stalactiti TaxID=2584121 RepID=UPI0030B80E6F
MRDTEFVEDSAFDPAALVGQHYRSDDYYEVGREKIREFARAIQDLHPAHWREADAKILGYDALLAPLTFLSIVSMLAHRKLLDAMVGYDFSQFLQADAVLELHRPIMAGDRLVCDVSMESYRQYAGNDFFVTKNVVTTQDNELVQTTYTTIVARTGDIVDPAISRRAANVIMSGVSHDDRRKAALGAVPIAERADPGPPHEPPPHEPRTDHRFDDLAVGDELPRQIARVTRGDLVNYAGVSGDPNPIHWHDSVAALVGLPTVVAHGMFTAGLAAGYLTSWLGDPAAVTKYSVRFAGFAPVEAEEAVSFEFSGRVKSLDADQRSAVIALGATAGGRKLFGRATAEVRLS